MDKNTQLELVTECCYSGFHWVFNINKAKPTLNHEEHIITDLILIWKSGKGVLGGVGGDGG